MRAVDKAESGETEGPVAKVVAAAERIHVEAAMEDVAEMEEMGARVGLAVTLSCDTSQRAPAWKANGRHRSIRKRSGIDSIILPTLATPGTRGLVGRAAGAAQAGGRGS